MRCERFASRAFVSVVAKIIFEKFESIDTTGDACVSWAELVGRLGTTDDWLEAELSQVHAWRRLPTRHRQSGPPIRDPTET